MITAITYNKKNKSGYSTDVDILEKIAEVIITTVCAKAGNYIQLLKDVKPYIKYDWKNQEGCIIIDNALHNMKDNFGRGLTVSNRLIKRFPAAPGNHNLTWNAHGTHIKGPAYSGFLVQLAFYDAKGKKAGNA